MHLPTRGLSWMVTHPSTYWTRCCMTSLFLPAPHSKHQPPAYLLAGFSSHSLLSVSLSKPAVLNLWSPIKGYFIFCKDINTHTDIPILAIFHGTIFSDGPRPRDKICKWSASLKRLRTAGPDPAKN